MTKTTKAKGKRIFTIAGIAASIFLAYSIGLKVGDSRCQKSISRGIEKMWGVNPDLCNLMDEAIKKVPNLKVKHF